MPSTSSCLYVLYKIYFIEGAFYLIFYILFESLLIVFNVFIGISVNCVLGFVIKRYFDLLFMNIFILVKLIWYLVTQSLLNSYVYGYILSALSRWKSREYNKIHANWHQSSDTISQKSRSSDLKWHMLTRIPRKTEKTEYEHSKSHSIQLLIYNYFFLTFIISLSILQVIAKLLQILSCYMSIHFCCFSWVVLVFLHTAAT